MNGFWIALSCAVIIIIGYFLCFELKKPSVQRIMPIVILVALGSVGRIIFAFIPQVQPTTAIVIIAGAALGPTDGFMTGALCALVSNIILGQGPWTPFQMIAWGFVGALAGLISKIKYCGTLPVMTVYSAIAAFIYSILTDVYTIAVFWDTMTFNYVITIFAAGIAFNVSHLIGNIIFMLILFVPFVHMIKRVKIKYIKNT